MIGSLHVSGFKLFRDITLPRLARLNLLVGENNSGKSCLLEAISLYAGQTPRTDIVQIASGRSEQTLEPWDPIDLTEEGTSIRHPVFDLFHRSGPTFTKEFVVEQIGDANPLRVRCLPHRASTDGAGVVTYAPVTGEDADSLDIELALRVYRGDKRFRLVTRRQLTPSSRVRTEKVLNRGVAFLRAIGFSNEQAASMWDAQVQGPGQDLVLDWLRMLDPRIEDIAYVAGRGDIRVALLRLRGQGRIPLSSMGDGLTRMFHIALAAASAPSGVLLIDEFENGLHWTVQEKLWIALARAAREYSVQVFATTHSRDCIQGFTAAVQKGQPDDAAMYRLEREGEDVIALELPILNVDAAMREHEEVR